MTLLITSGSRLVGLAQAGATHKCEDGGSFIAAIKGEAHFPLAPLLGLAVVLRFTPGHFSNNVREQVRKAFAFMDRDSLPRPSLARLKLRPKCPDVEASGCVPVD